MLNTKIWLLGAGAVLLLLKQGNANAGTTASSGPGFASSPVYGTTGGATIGTTGGTTIDNDPTMHIGEQHDAQIGIIATPVNPPSSSAGAGAVLIPSSGATDALGLPVGAGPSAWDSKKAAINQAIGTFGVGSADAVKALATWGNANGANLADFAAASGYSRQDVAAMFNLNGVSV